MLSLRMRIYYKKKSDYQDETQETQGLYSFSYLLSNLVLGTIEHNITARIIRLFEIPRNTKPPVALNGTGKRGVRTPHA